MSRMPRVRSLVPETCVNGKGVLARCALKAGVLLWIFFFSGWVFESITGMVSSFHSGFCLYTLVSQPWRVTVKRNMF